MHEAASKLINDDDFTICGDDVILVTTKQRLRAQCLIEMIHAPHMIGAVEVFDAEKFLDFFDAFVGQTHRAAFFIK